MDYVKWRCNSPSSKQIFTKNIHKINRTLNLFQSAVFFFAKFPCYLSVISLIDNLSFSYFLLSFFAFSLSSTFNLILLVRFAQKQKPPMHSHQGSIFSLAVTYSHMGTSHTTIGITAFHFWVRDGFRWAHRIIAAKIRSMTLLPSSLSYSLSFKPKQADSQLSLCIITSLGESPLVSLYSLLTATHPIPLSCLRSPQKHLSVVWLSLSGN